MVLIKQDLINCGDSVKIINCSKCGCDVFMRVSLKKTADTLIMINGEIKIKESSIVDYDILYYMCSKCGEMKDSIEEITTEA
jgi:queuine/archaeosine tRNA-ribosyltransferase